MLIKRSKESFFRLERSEEGLKLFVVPKHDVSHTKKEEEQVDQGIIF